MVEPPTSPAASPADPGDEAARSLPALIQRAATEADGVAQRARQLGAMVPVLAASARSAGIRAVAAGRWLADTVLEIAPHVVFRDRQALRRQYPNLSDEEIAQQLISTAARTTAAIGAAAGTLAAVEFTAPPALLAAPVQIAAETLAAVAVELKLVAELHEIAGLAVPGGPAHSGPAYLSAWVHRRAARPGESVALGALVGGTATRELRKRVMRRVGRSATSMAPLLAGAVAGAEANRRATRDIGIRIRDDLRSLHERSADVVIDVDAPPDRPVPTDLHGELSPGSSAP